MDARRTRKSNRSNLPVVRIWIIEVQRGRNLRMRQVPLDLFWDGCKADEKVKPQQPSGCEDLNYRSPTRQTLKTNQGGIAQLARASALQAEGRRFESVYLHKTGVTIFLICDACFLSRLMHCRAHFPYKIYPKGTLCCNILYICAIISLLSGKSSGRLL